MNKKIITASDAPAAIGPYSHAVEANHTLYLSGQIPLDPQTGKITGNNITEQTEQVFRNLAAVLRAASYDFAEVVKTTVLLADINDFAAMNEIYARYFPQNYPARSAFQAAQLPRGALVEIEVIAVKK